MKQNQIIKIPFSFSILDDVSHDYIEYLLGFNIELDFSFNKFGNFEKYTFDSIMKQAPQKVGKTIRFRIGQNNFGFDGERL